MTTTTAIPNAEAAPQLPALAAAPPAPDDPRGHAKIFRRFAPDTPDGEAFVCYLGVGTQAEGAKNPSRLIYLRWDGDDPYRFHDAEGAPDEPAIEIPAACLADYTLFEDFLSEVRARGSLTVTAACELLAELGYADASQLLVKAHAPRSRDCRHKTFRLRVTADGEFTACSLFDPDDDLEEEAEELVPAGKLRLTEPGGVRTLTLAYTRPEFHDTQFGVLVHDAAGRFLKACSLAGALLEDHNDERDWYLCVTVPRRVRRAVVDGWTGGETRVEAAA